ncbi:regulator of (H+)-ATPase in vacuolar membrane [Ceratobasidium sp. 370]|nr:regulator of (H+)-ATPase in vacuolar membrane [Ceratobasidium sp. 370]
MLRLCQSLPGQHEPDSKPAILVLPHDGQLVLAYPSFDVINILEAKTLRFLQAIDFAEALPRNNDGAATHVGCVACDQYLNLLFGASGEKVAVWTPSSSFRNRNLFRVHSTLSHPSDVRFMSARKGVLAIAGLNELTVYRLDSEQDLPKWLPTFKFRLSGCSRPEISPGLTRVSCIAQDKHRVHVHSLENRQRLQSIAHIRLVEDIAWRGSTTPHGSDVVLYTITVDSTVRIFMPVLDSPDHLQLHASIDLYAFGVPRNVGISSRICWLDRDAVAAALNKNFEKVLEGTPEDQEEESAQRNRLKAIVDEGWDLFAVVTGDGTVIVRAVTNIDRRPPTLLHQFATLHSPPQTVLHNTRQLSFYHEPASSSTFMLTMPQLHSYSVLPVSFFDAQANGVRKSSLGQAGRGSMQPIKYFVRTASGMAFALCYKAGGGEVWKRHPSQGIVRIGRWPRGEISVVICEGQVVVSYTKSIQTLTVYHLPSNATRSLNLPDVDSLVVLMYTKQQASLLAVATDRSITQLHCTLPFNSSKFQLNFLGPTPFPVPTPGGVPTLVLSVDPMGWSFTPQESPEPHDSLLTISKTGVLAFWTISTDGQWRATGQVHTQREGIKWAKCSTAKKSALVVGVGDNKEELTVWDHKESEFSSGEPIQDLDWTSTVAPQSQSILAIGFARHVILLCQQRLTYFDDETSWREVGRIELSHLTPRHISDSIWLAGGALLVGAGHQMFLHDASEDPSEMRNGKEEHNVANLFELVASQNGPLEDHHPQMLLQCLLWGKIELVKDIIVRLAASFDAAENAGSGQLYFTRVSPWEFLSGSSSYDSVLTWSSTADDDDPNSFSRRLVERLLRKLEERRLPHLSETEQAHLIVMIQTTLEIDEQRRSLDANGLRYLVSVRSFYTLNKRLELSNKSLEINGASSGRTGKRDRLRYRDIVWAFHSESQQIMLGASTEACGGRMTWADAKALGVFLWTRSSEDLKSQMEVLARNQYMLGDRDPVSCSLFYFALGKVKLVHGLWRQAVWHKDHALMIKFLSNDFTEPRWRTAALKNAFALLSKQRFEFAAAFFMLGGSLQDAVNVCLKQLDDFQLAIALARVVEGDNGPVLRGILSKTVVPLAFESGNRWLGSWAFWMLDRRDLSVRILLTPLGQFAASLKDTFDIEVIGDPHFDDPSLALLFAQLKSKSLQTVKGVSEISGRTEFNFVLQMARVFCRMVAPDQPPQPPHPDYYTHAAPMPPPPPLPEPHDGTSSNVLDPMLHQPQHVPPPPPPPVPAQAQGSEAIVNAAKAERTAQDRERGRLRVQRFRMKRKLADAEAGKRDKETLKKIKFPPPDAQTDGSNSAGPSSARRGTNAKDTEAEMRERERGRLRVQAYRMRKKLAEAKDGMRDPATLKKIRTVKGGGPSTPQPAAQPPSYQPAMLPPPHDPMAHYPENMFNVPVEAPPTMLPPPPLSSPPAKTESLLDPPPSFAPTTAAPHSISNQAATPSRQRAVRTNWFHPTRWSTINAAGLRANFSSAHEIVRLAKLAPGGEEMFKTLDRGTVHKWIDKERGGWNESVLEKVRKAAVKEAESWDQGRAAEESGGSEDMQGTAGMGVFGPPPGIEAVSPELVDVPGAVAEFPGNIGVGEAAVMGGNA